MVYLICSSQPPYETSIFIATLLIRIDTHRHLINHPRDTVCKGQLGSNLASPARSPLRWSCLWPRDTPQQPPALVPPSEFHFDLCHCLLFFLDYQVQRILFRLGLDSSKQFSTFKVFSHLIYPYNFSGNSNKLKTLLSSKYREDRMGWGGGRSRQRGAGHEGRANLLNAQKHSLYAPSRQKGPNVLESPFQVDRLLPGNVQGIKSLFTNSIFVASLLQPKPLSTFGS